MNKEIGQVRCSIVRTCANMKCVFSMAANGYKLNPVNSLERNKNKQIERSVGIGYYPSFTSIGRGEFVDIICSDFIDKDKR